MPTIQPCKTTVSDVNHGLLIYIIQIYLMIKLCQTHGAVPPAYSQKYIKLVIHIHLQ